MEVRVVSESQAFASTEAEWAELYAASTSATPFQSWAWLFSWWENYGEGYFELRLLLVRGEGGLLLGALPLALERRRRMPGRLLFLGTGKTGYPDILAREGFEDTVAEAGSRALRDLDSWTVADLKNLRPDANAWRLFQSWDGPRISMREDLGSPMIDVPEGGWDELLASLSKNYRSTVRQALRRAEADGAAWRLADTGEAEEAARRLVALHRESWEGRSITADHLTPRWESFVVAAAKRMTERGLGAVSELRDGERVLASQLLVFSRDFDGFLFVGASREALRRYQVSSLMIWNGVNAALDRDLAKFDMMQGEEPYKLRWCTRVLEKHRMILGRNAAVWAPYAGYRVLRSRVKRYGKGYFESESAPGWVKSVGSEIVSRYRNLRGFVKLH